jgi:hypothetical protein
MSGAGTDTRAEVRGWAPPGPIAARFFNDRHEIAIINGPVGSAKTTTALVKLNRRAARQRPSLRTTEPGPGTSEPWPVRLHRTTVVRDTYRQLWRSTMPSWFSRYPKTMGTFTGAENAPASHVLTFALRDRTLLRWQVDFVAIGDAAVEDVLRGYETSTFYLNELDLLAKEVWSYAVTRYGRFPPADDGGCDEPGIVADCNAPVLESWLYEDIFLATPEELHAKGIALFRQPGGLDAGAENLHNLGQTRDTLGLPPTHPDRQAAGRAYYQRQAAILEDWLVRRMVHNIPGFSRAGKPVYPEFNDLVHVAGADLPGASGLPLIVGLDAGGSPAGTFCQRMPNGAWHILDELVTEPGTGPTRFGNMLAQRLRERFPSWQVVGWCDPSALYGADRTQGDQDWSQIVAAQAAIRIRPGPTNKATPRWEAVRVPLARLIDGKPGFLLSPRCRVLRAGFNAGYRYRAVAGTSGRFAEEAEKTKESHVHDALQYALSGGGEDTEIRARRGEERARLSTLPAASPEWSPYAA